MRIKRNNLTFDYGELNTGQAFELAVTDEETYGEVFIKTDIPEPNTTKDTFAVSLRTGHYLNVGNSCKCVTLNAVVHINRG
jgi:hypothetical protein